jgi:hypothetical protein
MAGTPELLTLKRNRDLVGWRKPQWRRLGVALLVALAVAGLANVFGQRPDTVRAATPAAVISVYAPARVRGGLYYEARIHITARRELKNATVVLGTGWAEGMTINTILPSPIGEASRNGRVALQLGHIPAGESFVLYLQMQVNPTNIGRREQDVELDDGPTRIASLDRTITIFP